MSNRSQSPESLYSEVDEHRLRQVMRDMFGEPTVTKRDDGTTVCEWGTGHQATGMQSADAAGTIVAMIWGRDALA